MSDKRYSVRVKLDEREFKIMRALGHFDGRQDEEVMRAALHHFDDYIRVNVLKGSRALGKAMAEARDAAETDFVGVQTKQINTPGKDQAIIVQAGVTGANDNLIGFNIQHKPRKSTTVVEMPDGHWNLLLAILESVIEEV